MTRKQSASGRMSRRPLRDEARAFLQSDQAGALRRLAREATGRLDQALAGSSLSATQCQLMCLIATAADDSMAAIARLGCLDPSTLTRTLAPLSERGLIEIQTSEADRRRRAVWLTEKGLMMLGQALDLARESQKARGHGMPPAAPLLLARWLRAWGDS